MGASLFGAGGVINVNVAGTLVPQSFTGLAGQTVFNITNFTYTPGTNSLLVFINGQRQTLRDFVETDLDTFTLNEGVIAGDFIDIIGFPTLTSVDAAALLFSLGDPSNAANGDALIAVKNILAGGVSRTQHSKNADYVNVKDFGAIGTAAGAVANQAADTAAFAAALATGRNVWVPTGTYYTSATLNIGAGQCLCGEGRAHTFIYYSGTGNGVYMGAPGNIQLVYDCECRDITVFCNNRAATVNGCFLENCVYFNVENCSFFGSGSPNSVTPADWVLFGAGLMASNNSIIGRISRVACRLWNMGYYFKTLVGSQSFWTAAITCEGQGEVANNMFGIVVGDATIGFFSGVACAFRDISVQGNYTTGVVINSGDGTIIENCYFEGNANHDVVIGTVSGAPAPIGCKVINNVMETESIGPTNYGNFPYFDKVTVVQGSFTKIRDNNMSISTAIPLVTVAVAAQETNISGNRLNSTIATTARINNASTSTVTTDNSPEAPRAKSSFLTRTLSTATGTVAYTGVGFKPTSIEFWGAVDTTIEFFQGSANLGVGIESRCMCSDSAGAKLSSVDAIRMVKNGAGNEQKAVVASFDADGFTLNWTKIGAPPANDVVVNYIARR